MDMTLAELQEMAARQQQQIEAQQQLLASKVCESTRWKVGAGRVQKWVETQDTKAAMMAIKAKARGGRGSKYWGNNKVDVVVRMGEVHYYGQKHEREWNEWYMDGWNCRLPFLSCLDSSVSLLLHHFCCLLAVNRQHRLGVFPILWG